MSSMVLVGNLGSHWWPLGALGGPQTRSNRAVSRERTPYGSERFERFTRTETVRFTTVHGNEPHVSVCHLEALDYL